MPDAPGCRANGQSAFATTQTEAHFEGSTTTTEGSLILNDVGFPHSVLINSAFRWRIITFSALLERTYAQCLQALADHTVCLVQREQNISNDVTSPQHVEIVRPSLASTVLLKVARRKKNIPSGSSGSKIMLTLVYA